MALVVPVLVLVLVRVRAVVASSMSTCSST
jgi:hypothetical protein